MTDIDRDHLLLAAADGDQRSWETIVARHADLVWAVARSFRLGRADAADVCQATWLSPVRQALYATMPRSRGEES